MKSNFAWTGLVIRDYGKGIPYGGDPTATSGNRGFFNTRAMTEQQLRQIPEVADDSALQHVLVTLNKPESAFFTVGCEKSFNPAEIKGVSMVWAKGYVEVAVNSRTAVADAQNYFRWFFHFDQHIKSLRLPPRQLSYIWELEGAAFVDAKCEGFTASIWVTVEPQAAEATTRALWDTAWREFADFSVKWARVAPPVEDRIYP